jgi:hypothetical protein
VPWPPRAPPPPRPETWPSQTSPLGATGDATRSLPEKGCVEGAKQAWRWAVLV